MDAAAICISLLAILLSFVVFRINRKERLRPTAPRECAWGDGLTADDLERISHSAVISTEAQRNVAR